jgi:DNA-directed RNA polymerase subunit RPC12/RpoP
MKTRRCSVCKADTQPATLSVIAGEEPPLAIAVHDLPVLVCPQGHRHFALADFPLLLLDRLLEQDAPRLPAGEAKGVLFKHYHCASCGAELPHDADHRHTFKVEIALGELPPFEVDLTLPVHRCTRCGHEQLHSLKDVRNRTPAALAHAFKAAEIVAT